MALQREVAEDIMASSEAEREAAAAKVRAYMCVGGAGVFWGGGIVDWSIHPMTD